MKQGKLLLYSGGMDSFIAWEYLNRPATLYVDLQHRYAKQEMDAIIDTIPWTIIDKRLSLKDQEDKDAHIPMRNAFLLMIASFYNNDIVLVVQKGEMTIPDRSDKFFQSFGSWLSWMNNTTMKISTPFADMTKTQMVTWYLDSNLPIEMLLRTRSCFSNTSTPCGACAACFRRWVALQNNGLHENYLLPMLQWDGVKEYVTKMEQGKYDEMRTKETMQALEKAQYFR